jgi:hypothetical protein
LLCQILGKLDEKLQERSKNIQQVFYLKALNSFYKHIKLLNHHGKHKSHYSLITNFVMFPRQTATGSFLKGTGYVFCGWELSW